MAKAMRAKVRVVEVKRWESGTGEVVNFTPVCDAPFGPEGESEDNTYARYTPSGFITLTITNPALLGAYEVGQKLYVDFTPAE